MLGLPEVEAIVAVVVSPRAADDVARADAAKLYGEAIGVFA